jgi:uncharacterized protein (DUF1684 family)
MSKKAKILLTVAVCFVLVFVGSGMLVAATVVSSGLVKVAVHQPDMDMDFTVPAALVHMGLVTLPLVLEEDVVADLRADLGEAGPAAAAALRALEEAPDAVLVDVQDNGESVRVVKQGRHLEVHVESADGTVEISLPTCLLGSIARAIA